MVEYIAPEPVLFVRDTSSFVPAPAVSCVKIVVYASPAPEMEFITPAPEVKYIVPEPARHFEGIWLDDYVGWEQR